jgi:hypothetical protein
VKTIREGSLYGMTPNFPRRNQLMKKGTMVEPLTNPMNVSMVYLKNVIPKYHRVL